VLEVVRIRREGYPTRMTFRSFFRMFEILAYDNAKLKNKAKSSDCSEELALQATEFICSSLLSDNDFQTGKTMVFLRDDVLGTLSHCTRNFYKAKATKVRRNDLKWLQTATSTTELTHALGAACLQDEGKIGHAAIHEGEEQRPAASDVGQNDEGEEAVQGRKTADD